MTLTYAEAIEQAAAHVAAKRLELQAAETRHHDLICQALTAGASFRQIAGLLGVSPSTVLRRYGAKGELPEHFTGLDLPVGTATRRSG